MNIRHERELERYNRSCKNKKVFLTEEEAKAFNKQSRKKYKARTQVYKCIPFCGKYHIGHVRKGSNRFFLELTEIVAYQKDHGY